MYLCICKPELAKRMNQKITHRGIVDSVEDAIVKVRILQTSACASCKVAGHCNAAESKVKFVDVYRPANGLKVGDEVTVCASRNVISRAMTLAFALPLGLLVVTLLSTLLLTDDEGLSGLLALGILVPYYAGLWLFKERIGRQISFQLED